MNPPLRPSPPRPPPSSNLPSFSLAGTAGKTVDSRRGAEDCGSERERFFAKVGVNVASVASVANVASSANCVNGVNDVNCVNSVGFHQEADGGWSLSNSLVRLSGRIGSSSMVDEVAREGRVYGSCNARVMTTAPNWPPVTRLVSATPEEAPNGCRSVVLVGESGAPGGRALPAFAITLRFTLAPESPEILAEILSVQNLGDGPLGIQKLFLCPLAGGDAPPERVPTAINVWKGGNESYWRLADGSRYGARSLDPSADGFNLWTEADGRQHADIPFRPAPEPITLAPGKTMAAPRPMDAILVLDPPAAQ